jgi:hypothetical protein
MVWFLFFLVLLALVSGFLVSILDLFYFAHHLPSLGSLEFCIFWYGFQLLMMTLRTQRDEEGGGYTITHDLRYELRLHARRYVDNETPFQHRFSMYTDYP